MAPGGTQFDNLDDDASLVTMGSVVTMGSGPVVTNLEDVEINFHNENEKNVEEDNRSVNRRCQYEAFIPITPHGLLIMLKNKINGTVEFNGYAKKPDGSMGPAETDNLIRNLGDVVIEINGCTLKGLQFMNVLSLIRNFVKHDRRGFITFKLIDCIERDELVAATKPIPPLEIVTQGFKESIKHIQEDFTKGIESVHNDIKKSHDLIPKGMGILGRSLKNLGKHFSSSNLSKNDESEDDRSTGTNSTSNSTRSDLNDDMSDNDSLVHVEKKVVGNKFTGKKVVKKVIYHDSFETAEYVPRFGRRYRSCSPTSVLSN